MVPPPTPRRPRSTPPEDFVEHRRPWSRWGRAVQWAWLDPAHGPALLALAERTGAEPAWATTWERRANAALGLPPLPVVGVRACEGKADWRSGAAGRFARGRPPAWLDDDFALFPTARRAFPDRRRDLTALVAVDPTTGITDEHPTAVETALRP